MQGVMKERRVLCNACWMGGQKSKVYPTFFQEVGTEERACFYDEDGRYHVHESSEKKTVYTCSKGHTWNGVEGGGCWCGWKEGAPDTSREAKRFPRPQ